MIDEFLNEQMVACTMVNKIVKTSNVSHAYLIETNNYYRGFDFALAFAKTLLCPKTSTTMTNCGKCTQCLRIDNHNFPELEIIEPDGTWIKKEQLDKIQKNFSTKSLESSRKIYIINHADRLNVSSSNSILKFLEEPEENIIAILITDNIYSLLDTIISRCQIIKLNDRKKETKKISTLENISNHLFNNEIDIINFNESCSSREIISNSLAFVMSIENNGVDVILKENSLCSEFVKDKTIFNQFLSILVLFYKDCLDYLVREKMNIFKDYTDEILFVCKMNDTEKIMKKIEILTKMQERIKYNCNLNLILDKLIILLGGV